MHGITSSEEAEHRRRETGVEQTMKIRSRSCRNVGLWVAGPIWLKLAVWGPLVLSRILSLRLIHAMHALTSLKQSFGHGDIVCVNEVIKTDTASVEFYHHLIFCYSSLVTRQMVH